MYFDKPPSEADMKDLKAEEKYKVWLREQYASTIFHLVDLLHHSNPSIQDLSLTTMMKFVEAEGQTPIRKITEHQTFPSRLFQKVFNKLLDDNTDMSRLWTKFQEYTEFDDVRFYVLTFLHSDLKHKKNQEVSDTYVKNVFSLLENLTFNSKPRKMLPGGEPRWLAKLPENEDVLKSRSVDEQKKLFSTVWLKFLRFKLNTSMYKRVLMMMHDKVIPNITSPLFLCDFLTDSYNIGGAISLLALNSIFILINNYNLDYPDFYKKLYALFDPIIFHAKYRARFFHLADLFLSSTHLPAYLVAAFAKKLARLCLTGPASGIRIAITFILNLLKRHPNCQVLLGRLDGPSEIPNDPYIFEETDPAKCKAMESYLWEIKTLQTHYCPEVVLAANKINHQLGQQEELLGDVLDLTTDELIEKECKRRKKETAINFIPPTGLFQSQNDKFSSCWTHIES
ncbi:nucleolar complex protein 4 homolog [Patella vulgata]|uniref:nucleolar complex protein 4 homolog n=1 Tax=Patella vulgata TaxID=6465 RepID=UPI00217FCF0B|nr:nucleolar complex protein 4 homolog [Patella vulgata]